MQLMEGGQPPILIATVVQAITRINGLLPCPDSRRTSVATSGPVKESMTTLVCICRTITRVLDGTICIVAGQRVGGVRILGILAAIARGSTSFRAGLSRTSNGCGIVIADSLASRRNGPALVCFTVTFRESQGTIRVARIARHTGRAILIHIRGVAGAASIHRVACTVAVAWVWENKWTECYAQGGSRRRCRERRASCRRGTPTGKAARRSTNSRHVRRGPSPVSSGPTGSVPTSF